MANYGFETNKLQSMFNAALVRAGVVTGLASTDTIPNGGFVVADNTTAIPSNVYGGADLNLENFKKFATDDVLPAYIIDAAEVPELSDGINSYKVGSILTGMTFDYQKQLRMRKLEMEDRFYIYDGNITGTAPTAGKYLVPTNGSFAFTVSDTKPASGFAAIVQAIMPLTAGLQNLGNKYLCKVVQL